MSAVQLEPSSRGLLPSVCAEALAEPNSFAWVLEHEQIRRTAGGPSGGGPLTIA